MKTNQHDTIRIPFDIYCFLGVPKWGRGGGVMAWLLLLCKIRNGASRPTKYLAAPKNKGRTGCWNARTMQSIGINQSSDHYRDDSLWYYHKAVNT